MGYLVEADGGTLFLDEVGELARDVQSMLLRTLETGELRELGATGSRHVDVRVIAATDADISRLIEERGFSEPLLHRLGEYVIQVPPLRDRMEDIGLLLVHFVRATLRELGAEHRIEFNGRDDVSWLDAGLVARLLRYQWPGNVRQLLNVSRQLAIAGHGEAVASATPHIEDLMADSRAERWTKVPGARSTHGVSSHSAHGAGDGPSATSPRESAPDSRRLNEISDAELEMALRKSGWRRDVAAKALGISRTSIYALIQRSGLVRNASEITEGEIERVRQTHGGDVDAMADSLRVSPRALKLRMKQLAS